MSRAEVRLGSLPRGSAGRFSGVDHAFAQAAGDALKKYALFDNARNAADLMAKLFRSSNFGYTGRPAPEGGRNTRLSDFTWGRETGWFSGGGVNFSRAGV